MTKKISIAAALALALVITATAGKAHAAVKTCDGGIENIDYRQVGNGSELLIGCRATSGAVTNVYANNNAATCTQDNQTLDTLKFWFSMVSAWSLSSKKVVVYYDVCGGQNRITTISLVRQ